MPEKFPFFFLFIFLPAHSQAVVWKVYPAKLSLNVLICFFASLQSSFLALFFARNPNSWKLEWNIQLLTIIYAVSIDFFHKCMPFSTYDAFEAEKLARPICLHLFLITFIIQGVVISALVYYLQTWCISNKGPVFAAMFSPLLLIIVGIFSAIFFAERLHLGRWAILSIQNIKGSLFLRKLAGFSYLNQFSYNITT